MDRFVACAIVGGLIIFAVSIGVVECAKPEPLTFVQEQEQAAREGRGEYYRDDLGRLRFHYFDSPTAPAAPSDNPQG